MPETTKAEIGSDGPMDKTKQAVDNLVDDLVGVSPEEASDDEKVTKPTDAIEEKEEDKEESEDVEESESGEAEEPDEEADDDVVASSKVEKMREKMQKRIDSLTAKVRQLQVEPKEPQTQIEKLEALQSRELEELLENADDSLMDAKVEQKTNPDVDQSKRIDELKTLKKNIKITQKNAPQRFVQRQNDNMNKVLPDLVEIDPEISSGKGELMKYATMIFQNTASLQRSDTGKAEALLLAAQHYQLAKNLRPNQEKMTDLSRKVSSLKKKTTLDGKVRSGHKAKTDARKLRDKAVGGNINDKIDFINKSGIIDGLIPEEFL